MAFIMQPGGQMITFVDGNLFRSPAQTLVNTVNTVGVMGKGVAKEFKEAFPAMYAEYRRLCERGRFRVGTLWLYKSPHKWVLNFPTKEDWRRPSRPEYVEQGLRKFVETYEQQGITSVAFPALGCGNGGLDWPEVVKPLMERYLGSLPIDVMIYPHRQMTEKLEHETPEEVALWLRSQPEVLSFHEFWTDISERLRVPRTFSIEIGNGEYQLALCDAGIEIRNEQVTLVERDEMLDLWGQLRRSGFTSDSLAPVALEDRFKYLLPLLAELPYVRAVKVGRTYAEITGPTGHGLQFLPGVDHSRRHGPRVQVVLRSSRAAGRPQPALPL